MMVNHTWCRKKLVISLNSTSHISIPLIEVAIFFVGISSSQDFSIVCLVGQRLEQFVHPVQESSIGMAFHKRRCGVGRILFQ